MVCHKFRRACGSSPVVGSSKIMISGSVGTYAHVPPELEELVARELKAAGVTLDRKILADIAVRDSIAFTGLVEKARDALKSKADAAA